MRLRFNHSRSGGFTLIEVLVVVAIIAVMIAILLPSLKQAREQGRAAVCGSNLSQIFNGVFMYAQEFGDVLPHFGYRSSPLITWWWFTQVDKYLGNQYELYTCPSDRTPRQVYVVREKRGLELATDQTTPPAGAFPIDLSYRGSCDTLDDHTTWSVVYGNNTFAVSTMPRKMTSFKRPASSIILVEGKVIANSEGGGCMRFTDVVEYANPQNTIAARRYPDVVESWRRHVGRSNFLFLDGHVGRHTPKEAAEKLPWQQEYARDLIPRQ